MNAIDAVADTALADDRDFTDQELIEMEKDNKER